MKEEENFGDYRQGMDWRSGNRAEEEAIFSKVREMKESLINQERMKGSVTGKSRMVGRTSEAEAQREYDPRVENIDKINSKIKQILNCLSDNEKNQNKYLETEGSAMQKERMGLNGSKIREASSLKRSYESHFQKKSNVLEKINVFEPGTPSCDISLKQDKATTNIPRKNHLEESTYPRRNWDDLRR